MARYYEFKDEQALWYRPWHQAITKDCCAGMVLAFLLGWDRSKYLEKRQSAEGLSVSEHAPILQFHTLDQISKGVYNAHGKKAIRSALKRLEKLGFIHRRKNPAPGKMQDNTPWFEVKTANVYKACQDYVDSEKGVMSQGYDPHVAGIRPSCRKGMTPMSREPDIPYVFSLYSQEEGANPEGSGLDTLQPVIKHPNSSLDSRFPGMDDPGLIRRDKNRVDWPAMLKTYDPVYSAKIQALFPFCRWEDNRKAMQTYYERRRSGNIKDRDIDIISRFKHVAAFRVGKDRADEESDGGTEPQKLKELFSEGRFEETLASCKRAGATRLNQLADMWRDATTPDTVIASFQPLNSGFMSGVTRQPWTPQDLLDYAKGYNATPDGVPPHGAMAVLYLNDQAGLTQPGDVERLKDMVALNATRDPAILRTLRALKFDMSRCREVFGYSEQELLLMGMRRLVEIQQEAIPLLELIGDKYLEERNKECRFQLN